MRVTVLREAGHLEAIYGMGLSYGVTADDEMSRLITGSPTPDVIDKMSKVATKLAPLGGGHNKFLRQLMVWVYIDAPLYWWKQMDQYKVGTTTSSESTMHTLMKRELRQSDFQRPINSLTLDLLNVYIACGDTESLYNELPSGFLQGRVWTGSYENIKNIVAQRSGHKLKEWDFLIRSLRTQLTHPELIWEGIPSNECNS